eukprot:TRINITY_DN28526_c0_g1_i3.p1 TRINITY_DN28526_c0_g1~~TRINITY_DN28526_c0_g1_i3.p1  ORF type:complete len:226 (+),score=33.68 TRINITY_DN28526_c0_g1_i3:232-909(+)
MDGETLLRSEFMRPTSRITVFAPINAAWNNLEANGIATADIQSNNTLLNLILKQHVLESVPQANGLASVSGELNTRLPASPLNTTSGLSPNNGGQVSVLNSVGKIQSAQILEVAELCLQRGIVFLIDQVLLPLEVTSLLKVETPTPTPTPSPILSPSPSVAPTGVLIEDVVPEDPIFFNPLLVTEEKSLQDGEDPIFFNPLSSQEQQILQDGEDPIFFNPGLNLK